MVPPRRYHPPADLVGGAVADEHRGEHIHGGVFQLGQCHLAALLAGAANAAYHTAKGTRTMRSNGLNISTTEWLTLMDALDKDLAHSNFTDFYYLCRTIFVKNEGDYDKLDASFLEYFKNIKDKKLNLDQINEWLHTDSEMGEMTDPDRYVDTRSEREAAEVHRMFRERLAEQNSEHNGGKYWIGSGGGSEFGRNGRVAGGIKIGDQAGMKTAFAVMGERRYKDFRRDTKLTMRQFQVALRELRQYSRKLDLPKTELDIDGTIDSTCNQGGYLKLEFQQPRKNTVKLMLLFDSGGSMYPYSELCNQLFQAVHKANHFKDVKTFYFHNCIYAQKVTFTVQDNAETPVAISGAIVDVNGSRVKTDASGAAEFNLRAGTYPAKIKKSGYGQVTETVTVADAAVTKDVTLIKQ